MEHWLLVYGQLLGTKSGLLADLRKGMETMDPTARDEMVKTDEALLDAQVQRFRAADRLLGVAPAPGRVSVRFEVEGPVAVVTIDRPERRNAVDLATAAALVEAFRRFDGDEALAVAVLTGAGGSFCAGADLKAIAEGNGLTVWPRRARGRWARPGCGSASR